jgi:hypothetical protein
MNKMLTSRRRSVDSRPHAGLLPPQATHQAPPLPVAPLQLGQQYRHREIERRLHVLRIGVPVT